MIYLLYSFLCFLFVYVFDKKVSKENIYLKSFKSINYPNLILYVSLFISSIMLIKIGLSKVNLLTLGALEFKPNLIPYIFLVSFAVPYLEEYVFRYLPYELIKNEKFNYAIVVISSFFFAVFHNTYLVEFIIIFIIALIFSMIYLKTNNLLYSFLMHSSYNFITLVMAYTNSNYTLLFLIIFIFSLIIFIIRKSKKIVEKKD